jgi:peptide/nickel transport system permease protein
VVFLKKVFFTALASFWIYIALHFILLVLPGGLADFLSDSETNLEELKKISLELQKQEGFWQKYLNFFTFNWGESVLYKQSAFEVISKRLVVSLKLSAVSLFFTIVFSLTFFLFTKKTARWMSKLLLAIPALGFFPLVVFSLCEYTTHCPAASSQTGKIFLLAAISQSLLVAPRFYREMEGELLYLKGQLFVLVLRAKGLSLKKIYFVHILKNLLPPLASLFVLTFLALISGSVLLELLFDIQGIGLLLLEAIQARDFSLLFPLLYVLSLLYLIVLTLSRELKGYVHA